MNETSCTIEFSFHAKKRWLERVKNKKIDEKEVNRVINQNQTQITLEMIEAYQHSIFLWQGALWHNGPVTNFNIIDDVIFVTDSNKMTVITVYRVDLPFPDVLSHEIITKSVKEIQKLKVKIFKYNTKWIPWFKSKREEQKQLQQKMVDLRNKFNKEMEELQAKQAEINNKIFEREEYTNKLSKDVEEYARILCNSLNFRQEYDKGLLK